MIDDGKQNRERRELFRATLPSESRQDFADQPKSLHPDPLSTTYPSESRTDAQHDDPKGARLLIKRLHLQHGKGYEEPPDGDPVVRELEAARKAQVQTEHERIAAKLSAGRYTLDDAARAIEQAAGERFNDMQRKLVSAAKSGTLPTHEPGRQARYEYGPGAASRVRDFYEEAYWDDLNTWLAKFEPRIAYRFPVPAGAISSVGEDVLMPLTQAAAQMADSQWADTESNRVLAVESWQLKYPDQPAPLLNGKSDDSGYLAFARHDTAQEIQMAIDRLLTRRALSLLSPNTFMPTHDPQGAWVSRAELVSLMKEGSHLSTLTAETGGELRPEKNARPVPVALQQEQAILAKLAERGIDPLKMPRAPKGPTSWPLREEIRAELRYTPDQMKHAWKRLRADKRIKDA